MSTNYEEWAERGFDGGTKAELREAAKVFGLTLAPNCGEDTIRERLKEVVGHVASAESAKPAEPPVLTSDGGEMPNLTPFGRWGGRRHDVTLYQPHDEKAEYAAVGWETAPLYIKYGVKTSIPEPHYHSLNNAKLNTFELTVRVDNGLKRDERIRSGQAIPFQYNGVTPGTEHLPGSLLEYYQRRAKEKNYFVKFRQDRLEEIYGELTGRPVNEKWGKDRIRVEVLRFLGPEYVRFAMRDEEEDEARDAA